MRLLILGVDGDGRSCVVEETEIVPAAIDAVPGTSIASLYTTTQSPPPPCPPGHGRFLESRLAPGLVSWYVVDHAPGEPPDAHTAGTELHHRNSLEMIVILEGSADMLLAGGEHPVRAGDCIVMPGSDHGLRTGPDGCRLMAFEIGTPRA